MRITRFETGSTVMWGSIEGGVVHSATSFTSALKREFQAEYRLSDVTIRAPRTGGRVIGIAENYPCPGGDGQSNEPLVFLKSEHSIIGPNDEIVLSEGLDHTWGEPELGFVVGSRLQKSSLQEAREAICGFTVANDITGRDSTGRDHHLARYKSADTYCVLGPWVNTSFAPTNQLIRGYQNDTLLREGRLSQRIWDEATILLELSRWMTFFPGDIVLTGTPPRVSGRLFLRPGDVFKCEVEGLGLLENRVAFSD